MYQFHNMVVCCSTYTTVVLALERYRAVWRPIEYHNNVNSSPHPWRRVLVYIVPVVIFSALFNIPKFFETKFTEKIIYERIHDPAANETKEVLLQYSNLVIVDPKQTDCSTMVNICSSTRLSTSWNPRIWSSTRSTFCGTPMWPGWLSPESFHWDLWRTWIPLFTQW